MSQKQLAYIAHTDGLAVLIEGAAAEEWLLRKHPEMAFVSPWALYRGVFGKGYDDDSRWLSDSLVLLLRCDVIVLVGPQKLTAEATAELALARALKLQINDYRTEAAAPRSVATDPDRRCSSINPHSGKRCAFNAGHDAQHGFGGGFDAEEWA